MNLEQLRLMCRLFHWGMFVMKSLVYSGFSLEVNKSYGVRKFFQEKSSVKETPRREGAGNWAGMKARERNLGFNKWRHLWLNHLIWPWYFPRLCSGKECRTCFSSLRSLQSSHTLALGFLKFGTIDIWGWVNSCCGDVLCPVALAASLFSTH